MRWDWYVLGGGGYKGFEAEGRGRYDIEREGFQIETYC